MFSSKNILILKTAVALLQIVHSLETQLERDLLKLEKR
jgi:hypothetical protein